MKILFALFVLVLSITELQAQQIEKTDICPVFYDSYKTLRFRNPKAFNPHSLGTSVTWNFSGATYGTDTFSRFDYAPAYASPFDEDYPSSDLAMLGTVSYDNSYKAWWYYSDSAAALYDLGSNRGFITFENSDPERLYQFPVVYQVPQHDQFCFASEAFGSGYNYCGRNRVEFDASGTLVLPYASFSNVKRLTYMSWTTNLNNKVDSSRVITYYWYKTGLHKALLEYNIFIDTKGDTVISALMLSPSSVNSTKEIAGTQLNIYPNPAREKIRLEASLPIQRIEIISLQGALLLQQEVYSAEIDVSLLPKGVYLLKAEFATGVLHKKLVLSD